MTTPSPLFYFASQEPGVKLQIGSGGTVTATLADTAGVTFIEWDIISTDETTAVGDYTLSVASGAVPGAETTSFIAGGSGTGGLLRARINNGVNRQTGNASEGYDVIATAKWYVPTGGEALEVKVVGEQFESDPTFGDIGIINAAVRKTAEGLGALAVTAPILNTGTISEPIIAISAASGSGPGSMPAAHYTAVQNRTPSAIADSLFARDSSGGGSLVYLTSSAGVPSGDGVLRIGAGQVAVGSKTPGGVDMRLMMDDGATGLVLGDGTQSSQVFASVKASGYFGVKVDGIEEGRIDATGLTLINDGKKVIVSGIEALTEESNRLVVGDITVCAGVDHRAATGGDHSFYEDASALVKFANESSRPTIRLMSDVGASAQIAVSGDQNIHIVVGSVSRMRLSTTGVGFNGQAPVARLTINQDYTDTSDTVNAYTSNPQSAGYEGIGIAEPGEVFAAVADLNFLRGAYETLREHAENTAMVLNYLIDHLQSRGDLQ